MDKEINTNQYSFDAALAQDSEKQWADRVKPIGSLGEIEKVVSQIHGTVRDLDFKINQPKVVVFASDHGIAEDDTITPWPQAITGLMLGMMSLEKAGINQIAQSVGLEVEVVDVGSKLEVLPPTIHNHQIANGSPDFRKGEFAPLENFEKAFQVGFDFASQLIANGTNLIITGEVGMGNTTPATAIICHYLGGDPEKLTGPGAGSTAAGIAEKKKAINFLLQQFKTARDPMEILRKSGAYEIAALAGLIISTVTKHKVLIVDGIITQAAALIAIAIKPEIKPGLILSHKSAEPISEILQNYYDQKPLLDLGLRLGEGTGGALAFPLIKAGLTAFSGMEKLSNLN